MSAAPLLGPLPGLPAGTGCMPRILSLWQAANITPVTHTSLLSAPCFGPLACLLPSLLVPSHHANCRTS